MFIEKRDGYQIKGLLASGELIVRNSVRNLKE